ncbi:MAG: hypothetical protein JW839_20555 [Candidatus Lokiarchaeota archaeon]|nr:hypothetical protein [Candidatus Lokiarchaeota archaeon]
MSVLLGFAIGVAAYAMLYVGKGLQKLAIEGFKGKASIKAVLASRHSGTWIVGLVLTTAYMLVQWVALLYAPVNIIASLEGIGLVILLVFSVTVLKESINRIEMGSAVLIIAGIACITLLNVNPSEVDASSVSDVTYYVAFAVLVATEVAAAVAAWRRKSAFAGIALAATAGTFMAFQTVAKRVTAANIPSLNLFFTLVVLFCALMTLLVTQFALAKGKANRVLPVFTSTSMFLATLLGVLVLGEVVLPLQVVGLGLVVAGAVIITAIEKRGGDSQGAKAEGAAGGPATGGE